LELLILNTTLNITLTPAELLTLVQIDPSVTILDVRSPAEFEAAHIRGSYNVPLDVLAEHSEALASAAGGPVVLVCRSGTRARQAEQTLQTVDLPRLHVLDGGLMAWESASLPLNRGRQRWGMERQVRGVAGGIALAGALAGLFVWRPLGGVAAGIGGGLLFSALTDSCAMASLLSKLPYNAGSATCDVSSVVRQIASNPTISALAAD
jgi:rhodanese-related sulfurtransferase